MSGKGRNEEVRQQVTDRMVAALEAGVVPWQKPWVPGGRPRSMSTGKPYQGINTWLLAMTSMERGYSSPWWGTFRQIQELGGQVRKGQNQAEGKGSTKISMWKSFVPKDAEPDADGKVREVMVARMYSVFNADQCEGLPERFYPQPDAEPVPIAQPQEVLDNYVGSANAAALEHDQAGRAYYSPAADEIHMPPMQGHKSPEHYYSTAFHEVSHSTGHKDRLARPGITELADKGNGLGSHAYGTEELAAQMGASFLLAETGIDTDEVMDNSAAYLGSWIETIKEDNRMIITAASQAQKIADMVLEPTLEKQRDAENERAALDTSPDAEIEAA